MSEIIPIAYLWSFDRNEWDALKPDTISVGIFQYLPKANGKGFKRSKSIRVKGYGAYPNKVYEKAAELCADFNEKKLRFESLPSWVQKQYSVPKPADRVEYKPDGNDAAKVRQIRAQVAKELLIPLGFIKSGNATYVRRHGNQIHLIYFQGSKWGKQYTVNLGFHYEFIPPFFRNKAIKLNQFHYLDCAVDVRIGRFLPNPCDMWYPYGEDVEELRLQLRENISLSLNALALIEKKGADPRAWLRGELDNTEWRSHYNKRFYRFIALHLNDKAEIEKYAEELSEPFELKLDALARKQRDCWIVSK